MRLIEEGAVPDTALPVERFRAHLRLGTGFDELSLQDGLLAGFLRAAIAAIEARTGQVLIARPFTVILDGWDDPGGQVLPLAPVSAVTAVVLEDADGGLTTVAPERWRLEADSQRPRLRPRGVCLPAVPAGGAVRISLTAGMAADWAGLPSDLGQAVMLLAAHYYEYRDETALGPGCMPFGVSSLIQRYRRVRLAPGAAR